MSQAQAVQQFESDLFGSLTIVKDSSGSPWFVGRQVAGKLGFAGARNALNNALNRHCPERVQLSEMYTETVYVLGELLRTNTAMISESDLYRLVMGSTLDSAQAFQDWVVREVLPSIREHGGYVTTQATMADQRANLELMEEINQRFSDFSETMTTMIRNVIAEAVPAAVTAAVQAVRPVVAAPSLVPMPVGFTTLDDLYLRTGGRISKEAFKSLLRGANWTRSSYDKTLEDGRVVRLTCWSISGTYLGEALYVNQLVDRICREARQITNYYYEHRLIVNRFRIEGVSA